MVLIPVHSSVSDPYLKRLYRAQSDPFKGTTDVVISSDPLSVSIIWKISSFSSFKSAYF